MKKLLCNVSMIVCIFSVMNASQALGQIAVESFEPSNCNMGGSATGDCSAAIGDNAAASGDRAISIGSSSLADAMYGMSFGVGAQAYGEASMALFTHSIALGDNSLAIGQGARAEVVGAYVFGRGTNSAYLNNTFENSIMMGMNSTVPTLFIGSSSGVETWGNVGIGNITAPASLLHVRDQIRVGLTAIGGDAGADGSLVFNNAANSTITFNTPASMGTQSYTLPTAQGANNTVLTTDASGNLSWAAPGTISNAWLTTGNTGTNPNTPDFNFLGTIDNVDLAIRTNNTEKMRVMAGGNVGIGTAAPVGRLHVYNATTWQNTDLVIDKQAGQAGRLVFQDATTERANIRLDGSNDLVVEQDRLDRHIYFKINDGGVDTEVMRIVGNSARVGIGTTWPVAKLDVMAPVGDFSVAQFSTVGAATNSQMIRIGNSNATANYAGYILGRSDQSGNPSLNLWAETDEAGDTGPIPVMQFLAGRIGPATVVTRPLFSWRATGVGTIMEINPAGRIGMGTLTPQGKLHVNGTVFANLSTTTSNPPMGPGNPVKILSTGELIEYTSTAHHKTEVQNIQFDKEAFLSLRPVDFRWREAYGGGADVGLIAEEVEELMPNMVNYHYKHIYTDETTGEMLRDSMGIPVIDSTQMQAWGVDYHKVVIYLMALAKEQDSVLTALTERIINTESLIQDCCGSGAAHRLNDPASATKMTEASAQLKVYPNPNDGNFIVEYVCSEGHAARLVLITLTGERIHLADNLKDTGREEFSISGASGMYQVVLESHEGRVLKNMKVILTR